MLLSSCLNWNLAATQLLAWPKSGVPPETWSFLCQIFPRSPRSPIRIRTVFINVNLFYYWHSNWFCWQKNVCVIIFFDNLLHVNPKRKITFSNFSMFFLPVYEKINKIFCSLETLVGENISVLFPLFLWSFGTSRARTILWTNIHLTYRWVRSLSRAVVLVARKSAVCVQSQAVRIFLQSS